MLGKVENSKIDDGAAPLTVGSQGKTRRHCLKINGAECGAKKQASSRRGVYLEDSLAEESDSAKPRLRSITVAEVTPVGERGNRFFFFCLFFLGKIPRGIHHISPTFLTLRGGFFRAALGAVISDEKLNKVARGQGTL